MNPEKMNSIIQENQMINDLDVFNSIYLDIMPQALFLNGVNYFYFT